jgi:hypothetical protein
MWVNWDAQNWSRGYWHFSTGPPATMTMWQGYIVITRTTIMIGVYELVEGTACWQIVVPDVCMLWWSYYRCRASAVMKMTRIRWIWSNSQTVLDMVPLTDSMLNLPYQPCAGQLKFGDNQLISSSDSGGPWDDTFASLPSGTVPNLFQPGCLHLTWGGTVLGHQIVCR